MLLLATRCLYSRTFEHYMCDCNLLPQLKIAHDMYIDWSFCSLCFCCYCVVLVLMFICHSASTITVEQQQQQQQQQQSNLDKLLNVQELISPIHIPMYDLPLQQLNMKWTNTYSTALGHQMLPLGVCLHLLNCISSKCQADLMHDCKCHPDLI